MRKLILPLLLLIILLSGFSNKEKEIVAQLQLVMIDGAMYIEERHDPNYFKDYCEVYEVIAKTYLHMCVDTVTTDPKIKKL